MPIIFIALALARATAAPQLILPFNPSAADQDIVLLTKAGIHGNEAASQAAEVYNNRIYYVVHDDGTTLPSKVLCFDPASSASTTVASSSANQFWTLKVMKGVLWLSHLNGKLWSYNGSTLTEMTGTPFGASNFVSAVAELNGMMYFATSDGRIYESSDGATYTLRTTIRAGKPIHALTSWKGWLYGGNWEDYSYSAKIFRSSDGENWSLVGTFSTYEFYGFVGTPSHLYLASIENAGGASFAVRATTNGTDWTRIFYTTTEGKHLQGRPTLFSQTGRAYFSSAWFTSYPLTLSRIFPAYDGAVESRSTLQHGFVSFVEVDGQLYGIGAQSDVSWGTSPHVISRLGKYGQVIVSNVRATQRAGTQWVDVAYDLVGNTAPVFVFAAASTDGGASYGAPVAHLAGDGVTSPVAPGAGRHIVWDAGADYYGQFSTTMRVKITVSSGTAKVERESNIFTVDTRDRGTGTVAGRVMNASAGVANAQVKLDGTSLITSSGSDGTFTLSNVPVGSGYRLVASTKGYATKALSGVTVNVGQNNVGSITLSALSQSYQVIPLQPDVNADVSRIEEGGVAYRYYQVLTADGKTNAPGVTVIVRQAGGTDVLQAGDIHDEAAGRVAGVSDPVDGIVRLRIPSASIGGLNVEKTFEVVESGVVRQTFQARVLPRRYEQVWKHKVGGGIGGKLRVFSVGGEGAFETEVRQTLENGFPVEETIFRIRDAELRQGLEFGPGLKIGRVVNRDISAGFGSYVGFDTSDGYHFSPNGTDGLENASKVYAALGDTFALVLGPTWPQILNGYRDSSEATLRIGGHAEIEAELGFRLAQNLGFKMEGDFHSETEGLGGWEEKYRESPQQFAQVVGTVNGRRGSGELGLYYRKFRKEIDGLHFLYAAGGEREFRGKLWSKAGSASPHLAEASVTSSVENGSGYSIIGWEDLRGRIGDNDVRGYKETLKLDLASRSAFEQLKAIAPAWDHTGLTSGLGLINTPEKPIEMLEGISEATQRGERVEYERAVYAAQRTERVYELDLDVFKLKAELGTTERGAEVVVERGRIWRLKRMPLASYPSVSSSLYPKESIVDLEKRWLLFAAELVDQAVNRIKNKVADAAETVIEAGTGAAKAVIRFGQGTIGTGSEIISSWIRPEPAGGSVGGKSIGRMRSLAAVGAFPPATSGNYVYGISGFYRFESTNTLNGSATLSIGYSDADAAGLVESDLRIYRFNEASNHWYLAGGTVNTVSNIVTATVTNLGTFAVAPPMPSGDLQFVLSTNVLRADGVSRMTAVVNNLLLNTGNAATQEWLYTVSAVGGEVLNSDADTNQPGLQIASTNASIVVNLKAPVGGSDAQIRIASVAGDAFGSVSIVLSDNVPPAAPSNFQVLPGQSRLLLSWKPNPEGDVSGYRIYYRLGQAGPPYDGTATVEGTPSPFLVSGTNATIRGLTFGEKYYLALSAVDTTGNESSLTTAGPIATVQTTPAPPLSPTLSIQTNGQYIVTWGLSEDDGYNDRDVVQYEIWRAAMPGGTSAKVAQADAGTAIYGESRSPEAGKYWQYGVKSVDGSGLASDLILANHYLPSGGIDNDNDGLIDGVIQTQTIQFSNIQVQNNMVTLEWNAQAGAKYRVQFKDSLSDPEWISLSDVTASGGTAAITGSVERTTGARFYRIQLVP